MIYLWFSKHMLNVFFIHVLTEIVVNKGIVYICTIVIHVFSNSFNFLTILFNIALDGFQNIKRD